MARSAPAESAWLAAARNPAVRQIAASPLPVTLVVAHPRNRSPMLSALVAAARKPLPLLSIQTLESWREAFDDRRPQRTAGMLECRWQTCAVRNAAPIELGGADAESRPPVKIDVRRRCRRWRAASRPNSPRRAHGGDANAVARHLRLGYFGQRADRPGSATQADDRRGGPDPRHISAHLDASINYARRGPARSGCDARIHRWISMPSRSSSAARPMAR